MKYFFIFCGLIGSLSCMVYQSSMYKVFDSQESKQVKKEYPYLEVFPPFWTPRLSLNDVERVADTICNVVANKYDIDISQYRFQVLGASIDGEKVLFFNFFKSESALGEYVFVFDGGRDYLQVIYNFEQNQVMNILINGES